MNPDENQNFEQIMESAIVVAWPDLIHGSDDGVVHVEYGFAPDGMLDHLQIWSSIIRGVWHLSCEYWMSASDLHGVGVRFLNAYRSEDLARILELVMQHQDSFTLPVDLGRPGLIAIAAPTQTQSLEAAATMADAFNRLGAGMAQPVAA